MTQLTCFRNLRESELSGCAIAKEGLCFYFRVQNLYNNPHLKPSFMKNQVYQKKTALSVFFSTLSKNFIALFESGNKKDFQRLKDFITS